jgi:hypothetical protein
VSYSLGDNLTVSATDDCDPHPTVRIIDVTSNESANPSDFPFGDSGVCLRSERNGSGNGRIYTVVVEAKDATGNTAQKSVEVTVPKSKKAGCKVSADQLVSGSAPECMF